MNLYAQSVNASKFRENLEKMSILAGQFMELFQEMQKDYKTMQSPVHRNTYNLLLSTLVSKILVSHEDETEMFMDETLLVVLTDLVQKKIALKLKTPGQIWDSGITDRACKMVSSTPLDERRENPNLLKCVSELPAFHPLRAGPGSWHAIHVLAANVKTADDHRGACDFIRLLQENFYCEVCRKHFGEYLLENPPEAIIKPPKNNVLLEVRNVNTGEKFQVTKLFEWTVAFHNRVNAHRHNYRGSATPLVFTLEDAYRVYYMRQYDTCSACKVSKDRDV